jgi:two-component system phosphate regulon sensor histidine kinase PhoR
VDEALVVLGVAEMDRVAVEVPDEAAVRGDARAIKQVLVNVVGNALKYAGDAQVSLRVKRHAGGCTVEVADRGPGIAPHELPRITEPFYTVGQGSSWVAAENGEGTGIGLALVKRLVDEMGGRLAIDSAVGEGTTVRIRLPAAG